MVGVVGVGMVGVGVGVGVVVASGEGVGEVVGADLVESLGTGRAASISYEYLKLLASLISS